MHGDARGGNAVRCGATDESSGVVSPGSVNGLDAIACRVHKGTVEEARWFAIGANKTHGLRRSNADKRRAVEMALAAKPGMSDNAISEHCGVSPTTVGTVRASLSKLDSQPATRTGRDGRTINVTNIGGTRPDATPPADAPGQTFIPVPADDPPTLPDDAEEGAYSLKKAEALNDYPNAWQCPNCDLWNRASDPEDGMFWCVECSRFRFIDGAEDGEPEDKYIERLDSQIRADISSHPDWSNAEIAANRNVIAEWVETVRNAPIENDRPTEDDGDEAEPANEQEAVPVLKYITLPQWEELHPDAALTLLDDLANADGGSPSMNRQSNDSIEWAQWSWNPVTGCRHSCPYCYARDIADRFYPPEVGFEATIWPGRLSAPKHIRVPAGADRDIGLKNIFTCSMADLFGKWVPKRWITAVLDVVAECPQWNFLFLTKFPARMAEFDYPDNAWLGTSVDCQARVPAVEKALAAKPEMSDRAIADHCGVDKDTVGQARKRLADSASQPGDRGALRSEQSVRG